VHGPESEDREEHDGEEHAVGQVDRDVVAGAYALAFEPARQPVGGVVEFAVGEYLAVGDEGGPLGRLARPVPYVTRHRPLSGAVRHRLRLSAPPGLGPAGVQVGEMLLDGRHAAPLVTPSKCR
jgi:hypothetical protein